MNKKLILIPLSALILGAITWQTLPSAKANANEIARDSVNASNAVLGVGIEHVKITSENNKVAHFYRDTVNLEEKSENYKPDGTLENKVIVTESGKRVISIGNNNGKLESFTWLLPENIANENKELISKSLLKEIKAELSFKKWIDDSGQFINDQNTKKIKSVEGSKITKVSIDANTDLPIKKEMFEVVGGKEILVSTEEYTIEKNDLKASIFNVDKTNIKEISAPVDKENTQKGN
ncbi:hypothetical protein GCM10008018_53970 [Paenibacillus marchantiophytorum]|uniref:Uncharacterized protein n=2 Tax=Paenibacillus marchantiophytorum TaxID=1619310 RepID=A0ABQ1F5V9_9BACL|nr:hypothetical protein GCM10008018_53970 [Paenibacillus marchantiophytorum]